MIDKTQHELYLEQIDILMRKDAEMSKHEAALLNALVDCVYEFEEFHYPMDPPTPEDMAEFRRDQERMK